MVHPHHRSRAAQHGLSTNEALCRIGAAQRAALARGLLFALGLVTASLFTVCGPAMLRGSEHLKPTFDEPASPLATVFGRHRP